MIDRERADGLLKQLEERIDSIRSERSGINPSDNGQGMLGKNKEDMIRQMVYAQPSILGHFTSFSRFATKLPNDIVTLSEKNNMGSDKIVMMIPAQYPEGSEYDPYFIAGPPRLVVMDKSKHEEMLSEQSKSLQDYFNRKTGLEAGLEKLRKERTRIVANETNFTDSSNSENPEVALMNLSDRYKEATKSIDDQIRILEHEISQIPHVSLSEMVEDQPYQYVRFVDTVTLRRILRPSEAKPIKLHKTEKFTHDMVSKFARGYFSSYLVEQLLAEDKAREAISNSPRYLLLAKFQSTDQILQIQGGTFNSSRPYFIITRPLIIGTEDPALLKWEKENTIIEELPVRFDNSLADYVIRGIGYMFGSRPPRKKISFEDYTAKTQVKD